MTRFFSYILICMITTQLFAQEGTSVQVKTDKGPIEGYYDASLGLICFSRRTLRKAARWKSSMKAPQPMDPWKAILQTKKFGPQPVQTNVFGDMKTRSSGISEDCLYLNVWRPVKNSDKSYLCCQCWFTFMVVDL